MLGFIMNITKILTYMTSSEETTFAPGQLENLFLYKSYMFTYYIGYPGFNRFRVLCSFPLF